MSNPNSASTSQKVFTTDREAMALAVAGMVAPDGVGRGVSRVYRTSPVELSESRGPPPPSDIIVLNVA